MNCVDTSTTIPFRSDISISNLLLGKSKVIKQNYTYKISACATTTIACMFNFTFTSADAIGVGPILGEPLSNSEIC